MINIESWRQTLLCADSPARKRRWFTFPTWSWWRFREDLQREAFNVICRTGAQRRRRGERFEDYRKRALRASSFLRVSAKQPDANRSDGGECRGTTDERGASFGAKAVLFRLECLGKFRPRRNKAERPMMRKFSILRSRSRRSLRLTGPPDLEFTLA